MTVMSPLVDTLLQDRRVYYTVGCHPHYAGEIVTHDWFEDMKNLIVEAKSKCVAIGECGLDMSKKNSTRIEDQIKVFKYQIKLAVDIKKPLVFHIRDAEKQALKVLEETRLPPNWPIHR